MAKLSDDSILARALSPAALDRESFADAYGGKGPEARDARALQAAIEALKGKRLKDLDEEGRNTARLALLYGEQWEESLADSNPGKKTEAECRRNARLFREMRHRLWGRSALEAALADGKSVDIRSLMSNLSLKSEP